MKPFLISYLALTASLHAQIFTPKDIDLNVTFANVNPAVTGPMSVTNGPGLGRIFVTATTAPAPPGGARQALKNYDASGPLAAPTIFTVDDTASGLTYSTQVLARLGSGQQYYFPAVAGLSTLGAPPSPWTVTNTATLVNFSFVDQLNVPIALDGGLLLSEDLDHLTLAPGNLYLTSGATGASFLARGGSHTRFILYADLGGNSPAGGKYRKKYVVGNFVSNPLPADTVQSVTVTIDTANNATAALSGRFDVTLASVSPSAPATTADGFFEIYAPTPVLNDGRPDYPLIHVAFANGDSYGNWEREKPFVGANFTSEASGGFTALDLLPSPLPGEGNYSAYGETFLRRSVAGNPAGVYGLQFFRTPILGSGGNPVPLIPNGTLATGDTFVIKPGYLTGVLTLAGPAAIPGQPAMLDHVVRSTSGDTNGDGLPDSDVTEWFQGSVLFATGVDALATAATTTASGGLSFLPLPGGYTDGTFAGNFNFALGGLNGEASFWKASSLILNLINQGNSADTYFNSTSTFTDRASDATLRREIAADATAVVPVSHEFGEVKLRIRAVSGTIYQPDIRRVIDDPDQAPNPVAIDSFVAFGWPTTQPDAATTASIRTLIPAGNWIIYPRIIPGDQPAESHIDLLPIKIVVPARGRLEIETGFRIQTTLPECLTGPVAAITGTIVSAPTAVTEIRYTLDGGPPVIVRNPNAADPAFSIDLSAIADGKHTITITAIGAGGEESSITANFHRDVAGLSIQQAVILTWGCGVLQTSTDMLNWSDVPAAFSPFAVPTTEPKRFWKVRYE